MTSAYTPASPQPQKGVPVARTALGDLRGIFRDGIAAFHGVPYATPPVGDLRFAPAAPARPWSGQRDATRHGPIAPQLPGRLAAVAGVGIPQAAGRGLSDADHLHAGSRCQGTSGTRLAAWRRLDVWLRVLASKRRRPIGA